MGSGYYPPGAGDDPNAPYNQSENQLKEVEVTVSVTLSKTVKILVDDYETEVEEDEDGKYTAFNYNNCDLHTAVKHQILLPQDLKDLKGWSLDDFEVILE